MRKKTNYTIKDTIAYLKETFNHNARLLDEGYIHWLKDKYEIVTELNRNRYPNDSGIIWKADNLYTFCRRHGIEQIYRLGKKGENKL